MEKTDRKPAGSIPEEGRSDLGFTRSVLWTKDAGRGLWLRLQFAPKLIRTISGVCGNIYSI